jgi:hypothetical protein
MVAASTSPAATSNLTVSMGVQSATFLDPTGCATGVAGKTAFGTTLPGTTSTTSLDCTLLFGSTNDTSMIRLWQRDRGGAAVVGRPGDTGLVADWSMEGDWADQSTNANALVPTNGPTFVPDVTPYGQAAHFVNASSQTSAAPYIPAYDLAPPFVVQARFRTNAAPASAAAVIGKTVSVTNRNFLMFVSAAGILRGAVSQGGVAAQLGSRVVTDGAWHHVALVLSGTNPNAVESLYVDGVLDQQVTLTAPVDTPTTSVTVGTSTGSIPFDGDIDEVRISNGTVTPADIKAWAQGSIADYGGGTTFASASAFGVCLRDASAGALTDVSTWTKDADGDCADGDADPWKGVAQTTAGAAAKIAYASGFTSTARVDLRFGVKVATDQPPGVYLAPVTFEVLAPSA